MIGQVIGNFEIVARAGHGAMGEVFIAEQAVIRTRVAIKVLRPEVSASRGLVQRFFNEARAVARIEHAGIVKIFDAGFHTNQRAYLIMEYLEGETLAARLKRSERLALRDALEIARQIASILVATHHAGIIHRDLKPANVLVIRDRGVASGERIKLLDFGIAKLSDTVDAAGRMGPTTVGAMGTPAYMAPEQWNDAGAVGWHADAYSLGCMVYEMATGRPPFVAQSIAQACAFHLHAPPPSLRARAPSTPDEIESLVLRLLAKHPAERAVSTIALEQEFATVGPGAPAVADPPEPVFDGAERTTELEALTASASDSAGDVLAREMPRAPTHQVASARRRRRRAIIGGVAALAVASIVAWRFSNEARRPAQRSLAQPLPVPGEAASAAPVPAVPPFAAVLAAANPFVTWRGAQWLSHQVTRREYQAYLTSLPSADAAGARPVADWSDDDPARPVAWVTFERATAFCRTIGARLPTRDEWLAASEGAWGLDPSGSGPGPLQEWTSTISDGLVSVCGGHARMTAAERIAAASEPLLKPSESQAGANPPPRVVAAETIGLRCVR